MILNKFKKSEMKKIVLSVLVLVNVMNATAQDSKKNKKGKQHQDSGQLQTLSQKPNIIYILADDLGIGDVSTYGGDLYKTPNIDNLAKNGMLFNNAYTLPLCGPSRATILTGRYGFRTSAVNQDNVGKLMPSNEVLTPSILKPAGYTSAMIGKWSQFQLTPKDFGFDDYITFKGSGVYWNKPGKKPEPFFENGENKTLADNEYMPELMHDHLVNFLAANKNKPFFVHYSMVHIHGDIQRTPDSKGNSDDWYYDNVRYMDKLVGKLMNVLDSMKLRENTMVIFMGDNGTAGKNASLNTVNGKKLIGKKGTMEECGALVPMIANWPGKIPKNVVTKALIDGSDFVPTFADLTGATLPTDKKIDGKSFLPLLMGKSDKAREWIFIGLGKYWYARDAKYKLNREGQLFDMSNAPFEEKLVADYKNNKEASAAYARLSAVLKELGPEKGVLDDSLDGSGRHANNVKKKMEGEKEAKKKNDEDNEQ
jgi:arylsulfatase A